MSNTNVLVVTGTVQSIIYGKTSLKDPACSFTLEIEAKEDFRDVRTHVRVNVYGSMVSFCEKKLASHKRVTVTGELMNRFVDQKRIKLTEIRCIKIDFIDFPVPQRLKEIENGGSEKEENVE